MAFDPAQEDKAIVWEGDATATTGTAIVEKIHSMITSTASSTHHWKSLEGPWTYASVSRPTPFWDGVTGNWHTTRPTGMLLLGSNRTILTFTDPSSSAQYTFDAQMIFIHGTENDIKISYHPQGGVALIDTSTGLPEIALNSSKPLLVPGYPWTEMRSITGTSLGFTGLPTEKKPGVRVRVAEYADEQAWYGAGNSLTILLSNFNDTACTLGCHVGRIIVPDNDVDYYGIKDTSTSPPKVESTLPGDALLVGEPNFKGNVEGSWLFGSSGANYKDHSSVIRAGKLKWCWFTVLDDSNAAGVPVADPMVLLQDSTVNNVIKPIPYAAFGRGRANGFSRDGTPGPAFQYPQDTNLTNVGPTDISAYVGCGRVGQLKYLRRFPFYPGLEHTATMSSISNASDQAWLGWNYVEGTAPTAQSVTILWSKTINRI